MRHTTLPIEAQPIRINCSSTPAATEIFHLTSFSDITPGINKSMANDVNPIILNDNWNFLKNGASVLRVNHQGILSYYRNAVHQGIHTKLGHFRYFLSLYYAPSVVCLSETKLSSKISKEELNVTNYSIIHRNHSQ